VSVIHGDHWRNFQTSPDGLTVVGEPTFEEWEAAVTDLKAVRSMMWVVGDMVAYGEQAFPQQYTQAFDASDYEDETLRKAVFVAKRFPPGIRIPGISFSFHQIAACLPDEEALPLLREAFEMDWTQSEFRQVVADYRPARETPFQPESEFKSIKDWLSSRRESWPAEYRHTFTGFVARVLEQLEEPDADDGGGGAGAAEAGRGAP
jgi:hypothetical protein